MKTLNTSEAEFVSSLLKEKIEFWTKAKHINYSCQIAFANQIIDKLSSLDTAFDDDIIEAKE